MSGGGNFAKPGTKSSEKIESTTTEKDTESDSGGFSFDLPQVDLSSEPASSGTSYKTEDGRTYTTSPAQGQKDLSYVPSLLERGGHVIRNLFGEKSYSDLTPSEKQEVQDTLAAQENSEGSSSSNSTIAPALTFEQQMALEKEKQATIDKEKQALEDIEKKLEEERIAQEEKKKQAQSQ